ncbi:MAG: hypothetical protein PHV33_11960 [Elusimicrobiales bacterium]|nr:hypothetical protein [Elusimicrobiales bacterium]
MTEENNKQVPPPPPAPAQEKPAPSSEEQESSVRAELAKARSRSKVMTAVAVSLGTILVILAGVAYVIYSKVSAAKDNFEEVFRAMPMPETVEQQNRMLAGQGLYASSGTPVSSLGMFSGNLPSSTPLNMSQEQRERAVAAVTKYTERPIMKEFMAEIKRNPDVAAALAATKAGGNPLELIAAAQNARGMEKVMMKYAMNPEFMKTMMEISNDPALKAFTGGMPGGLQPQGQAVSIPAMPERSSDSDGDGEMTFDPSAISGANPPAPAPAPRTKRVPSPVDSGQ